ncbi:helix-turn-helix transcriptional regulator [Pseudoalteromonas lipolytica]|uniref:helix-turn-helix transcriptional regulator n=1 Tax=Pseudoalteromonas lipolytica TaxID=570156 RepID=UPI003A96AF08
MFEVIVNFKIKDNSLTMNEIDDALFEAGFDDAIVSHLGRGRIAIELSRDSTSYADLVELVVADVMNAIPSAKIIRASCDSWQTSQKQQPNPFNNNGLDNPGIDVTTSRIRSRQKLKYIADIEDDDIVNVPDSKEVLHPARYFEALYLHKFRAQGLGNTDLCKMLDLPFEQYDDFLKGKIGVTASLAERLEVVCGMPREFWLRAQRKFDNSRK